MNYFFFLECARYAAKGNPKTRWKRSTKAGNPEGYTDSDKIFCSREKGAIASQKARFHNFFTRYGSKIADADRETSISCHSFRCAAVQNIYDRMRKAESDKEAMAAVRNFLGHGKDRPYIDALYVKSRKRMNGFTLTIYCVNSSYGLNMLFKKAYIKNKPIL